MKSDYVDIDYLIKLDRTTLSKFILRLFNSDFSIDRTIKYINNYKEYIDKEWIIEVYPFFSKLLATDVQEVTHELFIDILIRDCFGILEEHFTSIRKFKSRLVQLLNEMDKYYSDHDTIDRRKMEYDKWKWLLYYTLTYKLKHHLELPYTDKLIDVLTQLLFFSYRALEVTTERKYEYHELKHIYTTLGHSVLRLLDTENTYDIVKLFNIMTIFNYAEEITPYNEIHDYKLHRLINWKIIDVIKENEALEHWFDIDELFYISSKFLLIARYPVIFSKYETEITEMMTEYFNEVSESIEYMSDYFKDITPYEEFIYRILNKHFNNKRIKDFFEALKNLEHIISNSYAELISDYDTLSATDVEIIEKKFQHEVDKMISSGFYSYFVTKFDYSLLSEEDLELYFTIQTYIFECDLTFLQAAQGFYNIFDFPKGYKQINKFLDSIGAESGDTISEISNLEYVKASFEECIIQELIEIGISPYYRFKISLDEDELRKSIKKVNKEKYNWLHLLSISEYLYNKHKDYDGEEDSLEIKDWSFIYLPITKAIEMLLCNLIQHIYDGFSSNTKQKNSI